LRLAIDEMLVNPMPVAMIEDQEERCVFEHQRLRRGDSTKCGKRCSARRRYGCGAKVRHRA
jgi:hypothetical protein